MDKHETNISVADIIDVAGNAVRVDILDTLADKGPKTVNAIIAEIGLSQSLISHHLKLLYKAGYVTRKRDGKQIIYSLGSKELYQIVVIARQHWVATFTKF